jgi:hypothetical protein
MSTERRRENPGRRERAARKRHRRARLIAGGNLEGPVPEPLKLGRKHLGRNLRFM